MDKRLNLTIRKATNSEDVLIAQHFYQLWLDNDVTPNDIRADWQQETSDFIIKAREHLSFQAFVAIIENQIIGSVSCQLFAGLYPTVFKSDFRKYGYIWNVYVEADYRRQAIGSKLTKKAIDYLDSLSCTHAILHASPHGKPLYKSLGFMPKNEMILELANNRT